MNRPTSSSSIYMANLEYGMDEQFVRKLFEDQGEKVVYVRVIRKMRPEGSSYAYCFVDFGTKEVASRVLRQYNNKPIPGMPNKRFRLNHNVGRGESQANIARPEFSIFVGDLTAEVDDLMLHDYFAERYKDVKGAKVVLDEQGVPKGFGFVRFYSEEERNRAAAEMHETTGLGGKSLRISVATPKSRAFEHRPSSGYYGNNQYSSSYNGPWNQQWSQQNGAGDYNQYYQDGEWSAMNYEQYYSYQAQGDTTSDQNASTNDEKDSADDADTDEDLSNMEHGQEATDMTPFDADIVNHCYGEFYAAMQKTRWHPVDTYTTVLGS